MLRRAPWERCPGALRPTAGHPQSQSEWRLGPGSPEGRAGAPPSFRWPHLPPTPHPSCQGLELVSGGSSLGRKPGSPWHEEPVLQRGSSPRCASSKAGSSGEQQGAPSWGSRSQCQPQAAGSASHRSGCTTAPPAHPQAGEGAPGRALPPQLTCRRTSGQLSSTLGTRPPGPGGRTAAAVKRAGTAAVPKCLLTPLDGEGTHRAWYSARAAWHSAGSANSSALPPQEIPARQPQPQPPRAKGAVSSSSHDIVVPVDPALPASHLAAEGQRLLQPLPCHGRTSRPSAGAGAGGERPPTAAQTHLSTGPR